MFIPLELSKCACLDVLQVLEELITQVHTQLRLAVCTQEKLTGS